MLIWGAADVRKAQELDRWDSTGFSFCNWDCIMSWDCVSPLMWIALDEELSLRISWGKCMSVHFIHPSFRLFCQSGFKKYAVGLSFCFLTLHSQWIYISHAVNGPDINIFTLNYQSLLTLKQQLNLRGRKTFLKMQTKAGGQIYTICSPIFFHFFSVYFLISTYKSL